MLLDVKQLKNIAIKLPVRAVTTAALPACTYANGTNGFGATLTGDANGALAAQDGVTLAAGERLLVKNQVTAANNGIYVLTTVGSGGAPFVLTRAGDADTATKTFPGISVISTADGTTNKSKSWVLNTTTNPLVIGTTVQTWAAETVAAPVPSSNNKQMAASATTADFQAACATAITATPASGSYVQIFVNGIKQVLGDGNRTKDCYFSVDSGATARAISAITAGDTLYWVPSVAGYNLAATDIVDFDYSV